MDSYEVIFAKQTLDNLIEIDQHYFKMIQMKLENCVNSCMVKNFQNIKDFKGCMDQCNQQKINKMIYANNCFLKVQESNYECSSLCIDALDRCEQRGTGPYDRTSTCRGMYSNCIKQCHYFFFENLGSLADHLKAIAKED